MTVLFLDDTIELIEKTVKETLKQQNKEQTLKNQIMNLRNDNMQLRNNNQMLKEKNNYLYGRLKKIRNDTPLKEDIRHKVFQRDGIGVWNVEQPIKKQH